MATISISSDLDVLSKYDSLIAQSLGGESVYIRAKETIEDLAAAGDLSDADKAKVISEVISSLNSALVSTSMSTALSWAQAEKAIALQKLELAPQLDILEQDKLLKEAQADQVYNSIRLAKVESRRMYGVAAFVDNDIVALSDEGKIYTDMQLTDAQRTKVGAETTLTEQKMEESYAAVHKIVADTYVNYGSYTYTGLGVTGLPTITANHGSFTTLSDMQKGIAEEQARGYTYNAWANALTGTASMLGTAIAAEYSEFSPGSTGGDLLGLLLNTAQNLSSAVVPTTLI